MSVTTQTPGRPAAPSTVDEHREGSAGPANIRWQCPRGHFVADENIYCQDHLDASTYYGVSTNAEYTCRGCEKLNVGPYMYFDLPRLVEVGS